MSSEANLPSSQLCPHRQAVQRGIIAGIMPNRTRDLHFVILTDAEVKDSQGVLNDPPDWRQGRPRNELFPHGRLDGAMRSPFDTSARDFPHLDDFVTILTDEVQNPRVVDRSEV